MIDLGEVVLRVRHGGQGPLMVWSDFDDLAELYGNPLVIWERWAPDLRGDSIPTCHHMAEEYPDALVNALSLFFPKHVYCEPVRMYVLLLIMRWDTQKTTTATGSVLGGTEALLPLSGLVRTVRTPDFAGITFHEVLAKSVLNRVSGNTGMPFSWTVNPYRGCSHACVYCFARKTHSYLNLDTGLDFDSQLVVKTNAGEVLRRELGRPSWQRDHVAMGTNTDPYQRAEGRYKLMPGIIAALADTGTPFSILTKGTLLARDIPLLKKASTSVQVGMGISLAILDQELAHSVEPGTPAPKARLELISRLRDAGLPCGVMAMPILPWLTDSDEALDALFGALAKAGATGVSAGALHLRPGAREWFMEWLAAHHPALVGRYRRLYRNGSYPSKDYRTWLSGRIRHHRKNHGVSSGAQFFREVEPDSIEAPGNGARVGAEPTLF